MHTRDSNFNGAASASIFAQSRTTYLSLFFLSVSLLSAKFFYFCQWSSLSASSIFHTPRVLLHYTCLMTLTIYIYIVKGTYKCILLVLSLLSSNYLLSTSFVIYTCCTSYFTIRFVNFFIFIIIIIK